MGCARLRQAHHLLHQGKVRGVGGEGEVILLDHVVVRAQFYVVDEHPLGIFGVEHHRQQAPLVLQDHLLADVQHQLRLRAERPDGPDLISHEQPVVSRPAGDEHRLLEPVGHQLEGDRARRRLAPLFDFSGAALVDSPATVDDVVLAATVDQVIAFGALDPILPALPVEQVGTPLAIDPIPPETATHDVRSAARTDEVASPATLDDVVAAPAEDHVGPGTANQQVGVIASDEGRLPPETELRCTVGRVRPGPGCRNQGHPDQHHAEDDPESHECTLETTVDVTGVRPRW